MTSCPRGGYPGYDPADPIPCERCATATSASLRTVVNNLLDRYGVEGVTALLARLRALEPHDRIAPDYGVSGARVQQWAAVLGTRAVEWTPHEDMVSLAGAKGWAT